ncbi:hypothetical protein LCGC14_3161490 [marine sediment metagenome]|uniref:Uncharacterized protein n=1 Tax=marine sediment metagenome TaxID=412755 RepID=A0A0F8WFA7_9ZZZZ
MEELALEFGLPQSWIDENLKGIKRGVEAMKAGRVKPWEQVMQELNIENDEAGRGDFGH